MEGGYQFIHVDSYSRIGSVQTKTKVKKNGDQITTTKRSSSAQDIFEEQWRIDGACPHIGNPGEPVLLYGVPPLDVLPMVDEWAEQARDAQGRKLRKDGHCVLVGVASLPRAMEDNFPEFAEATLLWLREKYGDRLKSVVVHNDEPHPHLHFSVVPRIGEKFEDIHQGFKASKQAKIEGKKKGEQNLAYINAMRAYQDQFGREVAIWHGLTRIGPGRRRLSRAAWNQEKQQALAVAEATQAIEKAKEDAHSEGIKAAQVAAKKIISQAQTTAKDILAEAQSQSKGIGTRMAGWLAGFNEAWHQPTLEAKNEVAEAKKREEQAKKLVQEMKKKALEYGEKAKKWADERVANAGNLLVLERSKTKELESELQREKESNRLLVESLASYEEFRKKQGVKFRDKFKP